jgi:DNA (cytosine-5)-methyltransferase 1
MPSASINANQHIGLYKPDLSIAIFINPARPTVVVLRVVELFAGVGGFRIGFEGPPGESDRSNAGVVWANQWEPSTKKQHAAEVYVSRWGLERSDEDPDVYLSGVDDVLVNKDIGAVDADEIPDHDLLCGGFPCQDYSVAKTASRATGLEGKKGVLWWEIHRILKAKMPDYALLENVDRLLKSPTSQRGRDFAVMLASLDELGYAVEWRSFSSADYGFPQRRKRAYILAHAPGTEGHSALTDGTPPNDWLEKSGVLARAFPIKPLEGFFGLTNFSLRSEPGDDLADITQGFKAGKGGLSRFHGAGVMVGGTVWTTKVESDYGGPAQTLGDVLVSPGKVPDEFIVRSTDMLSDKGWVYLKGAKSEPRKGTDGFTYDYKEGPITFPDALDRPSRTMVTGEGGSTPSRFKHVVEFKPTKGQVERLGLRSDEAMEVRAHMGMGATKWLRRLTPIELERLNGFPDGHTEGVTDGKRAFFMGNALVCGIVESIGRELSPSRPPAIENPFNDMFSKSKRTGEGSMYRESLGVRKQLNRQVRNYDSFRDPRDPNDDSEKHWTPHGKPIHGLQIHFGKPGKDWEKEHRKYDFSNDMRCKVLEKPFQTPPQKPGNDRMSDIAMNLRRTLGGSPPEHRRDVFRLLSRIRMPSLQYDHVNVDGMVYWGPSEEVARRIREISPDLLEQLLLIESVAINEDNRYLSDKAGDEDSNRGRKNFVGAIQNLLEMIIDMPDSFFVENERLWKMTARQFDGSQPPSIPGILLDDLMS